MNEIVSITEKAKNQILKIFTEDKKDSDGLRLAVVGGGCSGLSYKIEFGEKKDNDNIQSYTDFCVMIDPKSSIYLKGVVLDYQDGLNGKGFVFNNPTAKNTCGCGESFSV